MMKAEALQCELVWREDTSKHLKGQLGSLISDQKSSLPVSRDPPSVTKNHHFQSVGIPVSEKNHHFQTKQVRSNPS